MTGHERRFLNEIENKILSEKLKISSDKKIDFKEFEKIITQFIFSKQAHNLSEQIDIIEMWEKIIYTITTKLYKRFETTKEKYEKKKKQHLKKILNKLDMKEKRLTLKEKDNERT